MESSHNWRGRFDFLRRTRCYAGAVFLLANMGLVGCQQPERTAAVTPRRPAQPPAAVSNDASVPGPKRNDSPETMVEISPRPAPAVISTQNRHDEVAAALPTPQMEIPGVQPRTSPRWSEHRSAAGHGLAYWVFGTGRPTTLILGGMHGGEKTPAELAGRFVEWLEESPQLVGRGRIVVAPLVDPDGLASGHRGNSRGVDLNRNYPARNWKSRGDKHGSSPLSEGESQFVIDLLAEFEPACVVSIHAPLGCVNYDGPAQELARRMSHACGLPVRASVGYPTPGSFGSYCGDDLNIPTITLELRSRDEIAPSFDACREALMAAHAWALENPSRGTH